MTTGTEIKTPRTTEEVTEEVELALNRAGMFTVRTDENVLGYIDTERSAVYLIYVHEGQFRLNE